MFRAYYKMYDARTGPWTYSRVRDLCNALQMTEDELAEFIRISPNILRDSQVRPIRIRAVTLLLSLVESWVKRTRLGDPDTQVFPTHLL